MNAKGKRKLSLADLLLIIIALIILGRLLSWW